MARLPNVEHIDDANMLDQERIRESHLIAPEFRHHDGSPSQKTAMPRWRGKGREKSVVAHMCTWIVDHQIRIAVNLLSTLFLSHILFPFARHYTRKFFSLSYYNPATGTFALGWDDIFFVFYWIIVFTGMRCFVMDYVLSPLGTQWGITGKKNKTRFAEQAWILIYDSSFWCTGMYIMYNSDYWLNLRALWRDWPIREMQGLAKWYYLVQFAFWLQQIAVVNIEERRKDHWQMFTHHIITCALIFTSYGYHQSRVGTVILCLMDIGDIILPLAKILKYLGFSTAPDIAFAVFIVTWFVSRHVLYGIVLWSIYADIPKEIGYGCYHGSVLTLQGPTTTPNDWDHLFQPFRDPEGLVCWNNNIRWTFLGMLLSLQVVLLVWFGMILRVAYKVISGQPAEDTRSDDEDEEEEELIDHVKLPVESHSPVIEKNMLSTDPNFSLGPSRQGSTSPLRSSRRKHENGHSSGMTLRDHKELLGRIGCDKSPAD